MEKNSAGGRSAAAKNAILSPTVILPGAAKSSKLSTAPKKTGKKNPGGEVIWLSLSEAAKIGGVQNKTVRRALKNDLKFKIKGNRYFINFSSLIAYLHRNKKLNNKLNEHGLGQYVREWNIKELENK